MERVRILIADNHEIVRMGLRSVLESQTGYEVCGEAASGQELIGQVKMLSPDVVITELSMRGLDGLNAAREILRHTPHQKILVLTRCNSEALAREALQAGIRGLLLKSDALIEVLAAVPALVSGRLYFTPRISEMLLQGYLRKNESPAADIRYAGLLTARENEIVKAIACGMTNRELSQVLAIAIKTIETHRCNIMRKLDLHSAAELVLYALRNNLAPFNNRSIEVFHDGDEAARIAIDSLEDGRRPAHELTRVRAATAGLA